MLCSGRGQKEMTGFDNRLNACWWALKIGLGVGPIIIGLDKYFNKLTDWRMYLSPLRLLSTGMFYDLAMRDVEISLAPSSWQLTAVREYPMERDAVTLRQSQLAETR